MCRMHTKKARGLEKTIKRAAYYLRGGPFLSLSGDGPAQEYL